jgi:hypothetical protein
MISQEYQIDDTYSYYTISKHIARSRGFSILLFFYYLYKLIFVDFGLLIAFTCMVLIIIIISLSFLSEDIREIFRNNKMPKIGYLKIILYDYGLIFFLGILSFYLFFYKGVYGLILAFIDLSGWELILGIIKKAVIIYLSFQFVVSVDKVQTIKKYLEKENYKSRH